ncbi:MAG: class I SAM-dependent RNA methyltransferase [Deltaproteobacteria bacterium]|nr:class I SAM-dependent RNA methyltransferase [Deltaproteobacteria bacterium]
MSVRGLFGGETAAVEVVHRSRHHAKAVARVVELRTAHPARRVAPCANHESLADGRSRCGGCALMELTEPAQRAQKGVMLEALGLDVSDVIGDADFGYRWSSKRVAFADKGRLRLGSWVRGTHEGATMPGCRVDHALIAAAADQVEHEARALRIAPYDEAKGKGDLRYVWLKTDGESVLVTLIVAHEETRVGELAEQLTLAAGVAVSVQSGAGNAMRGAREPVTLRGVARIPANVGDVHVDVGPMGFLQPNPKAIAEAYRDLVGDIDGAPAVGAVAWDLYAGAGVTTALLRAGFAEVVVAESYPESAAALGIEPVRVEDFLGARAESDVTPDLIVANPPRKGLGEKVCAALVAAGAPRLHVMSCGPEGLARDLGRLIDGGYTLSSLTAYDTLPQTPHVEVVAKLVRG